MLSKRKQIQKMTYHLIPLYEILEKVKSLVKKSKSVVAWDLKMEQDQLQRDTQNVSRMMELLYILNSYQNSSNYV